jgi:hypothetical protein
MANWSLVCPQCDMTFVYPAAPEEQEKFTKPRVQPPSGFPYKCPHCGVSNVYTEKELVFERT